MCNKQNKHRKPYIISNLSQRQRLNTLYELQHYEKFGRFSLPSATCNRLLRMFVRMKKQYPARYKHQKQKLYNAIMNDMKTETNDV